MMDQLLAQDSNSQIVGLFGERDAAMNVIRTHDVQQLSLIGMSSCFLRKASHLVRPGSA
jgi:hypothetical protein